MSNTGEPSTFPIERGREGYLYQGEIRVLLVNNSEEEVEAPKAKPTGLNRFPNGYNGRKQQPQPSTSVSVQRFQFADKNSQFRRGAGETSRQTRDRGRFNTAKEASLKTTDKISENDFHPSDPVHNQRQLNRGRERPNRGRGYQPPRQMTKEDEERSERLRRYLKEKGRLEEDDNISRDMITTGGRGEERQEDSLHREIANGHHRREPTKNNYVKGGSRLSPMFDEETLSRKVSTLMHTSTPQSIPSGTQSDDDENRQTSSYHVCPDRACRQKHVKYNYAFHDDKETDPLEPPSHFLKEEEIWKRIIEKKNACRTEEPSFALHRISTFLIRDREDGYAPFDIIGNYLLDKVDQARVSGMESKKQYTENYYALPMEIEVECPDIVHREPFSTYLRPIFIDGCGLSFDYFLGGVTYRKKVVETEKLVPLFLYPVVQTLLVYILMGHKAIVVFPKSYKELLDVEESWKVDNLRAYKKLYELGLIHFWEAPLEEGEDILRAMEREYSKIGAGIAISPQAKSKREFSKPLLEHLRSDGYRGYNSERYGGHKREIQRLNEFPMKPPLSRFLMMSVSISGGRDDFLFISTSSRIFNSVEKIDGTDKRNYVYLGIQRGIKLFYTPLAGDINDLQIKSANQITIRQQVSWVTELIQLYELPNPHMYAVMVLFKYLYKEEICMNQLIDFMEQYPVLPPPDPSTAPPPPIVDEDEGPRKPRKWKYKPDLDVFEDQYSKWKEEQRRKATITKDFQRRLLNKEKPPVSRARTSRTIAILGNPPPSDA